MPITKAHPSLSGWVDSDFEDDLGHAIAARRGATPEKMVATKRGRGRPPNANKVSKPPQRTTRRSIEGNAESIKVLTDKSNGQTVTAPQRRRKAADDEDVVMKDASAPSVEQEKSERERPTRGRPARGRPPAKAKASRMADEVQQPVVKLGKTSADPDPETEEEDLMVEIPETRQRNEERDRLEDLPQRTTTTASHHHVAAPSSVRSQRATDVDASDPSLRRKLGDMTRKYESLELKYRDLREIAVKEAERNFDRLRKQTDERAEASKQLIADLKSELDAQTALAREGDRLRQQLDQRDATIAMLQSQVTELTNSLSDAKSENKTLSTKLAASRSADAGLARVVPGSAMKGGSRPGVSTEMVQAAQLKEDLYGDLTGLIIRNLKREEKEDVFDCLQTGRNGTLHFKLAIETDSEGDNYGEAQVAYRPQLDQSRDEALMAVLPDYLVEEISFPRQHSAKFYSRVSKALMEAIE